MSLNPNVNLTSQIIIHSDQGRHYTSPRLSEKVKELNLKQSMSRKGNCGDTAPQESFFVHRKDETDLKEQITFSVLEDYIHYYNHHRYHGI